MNNSGDVDPNEFRQAIEKIGIFIPTKEVSRTLLGNGRVTHVVRHFHLFPFLFKNDLNFNFQDLNTLFSLYDLDGSGAITYKEFNDSLFSAGKSAPTAKPGQRSPEELSDALKQKLCTRGARGFIGLQRQFKIMDDNNSKSLDKYEFSKAMSDYQLGFTEGEIQKLFAYFDFDRSGSIEFDEFVRAIRGSMNDVRKAITMRAFKALDKDGNGWIDINDIRGVYKADKHPDVLSGKKNEDQIL